VSRLALIARGVAFLLLLVATTYSIDRWVIRPLRCTYTASTGADALDHSVPADYKTTRLALLIRADLAGCTCVSPPNAIIPMTLGAAAEASGDLRAAIAEYQRALLIDRRPEIYFHLGLVQLETLDRTSAFENIMRACAFDPSRIADIPYEDLRLQTEQRLWAAYGPDWIR
jgi:tetratricopeptide (TPR) repeat protein